MARRAPKGCTSGARVGGPDQCDDGHDRSGYGHPPSYSGIARGPAYRLAELARVTQALGAEIAAQGLWETLLLVRDVPGAGDSGRAALLAGNHGFRHRLIALPLDTVQARLRAVGLRLAFGLGWTASFAVGSLGAFLLFDWPPLLHALIARVLLLVVVVWLTTILLRFVMAPGAERFRILPVSTASARHWYFWLTIAVGWYAGAHVRTGF